MTNDIFLSKVGDILEKFRENLETIFIRLQKDEPFSKETLLEGIDSTYIHVLQFRRGEVFIEGFQPLDYIYVLLLGDVYTLNYTFYGKRVISNTLTSPQLLGLIEGINGVNHYMATVVALSECTLLKINKEILLEATYNDARLSNFLLRYLAQLSTFFMENTGFKMSLSSFDKLLLYLYNQSIGRKPPITITENKHFIADLLNINIRTLYRYLDGLEEKNMIQRSGQSIILDEENVEIVTKRVKTIT